MVSANSGITIANRGWPPLIAALAAVATCSGGPEYSIGESLEPTGQVAHALGTVEDAVQGGCSTTSIMGLRLFGLEGNPPSA